MIKKIILLAVLSLFVFSCKTKHKVTYGEGNRTATVNVKNRTTNTNPEEGGRYALPDDDGKFMRYEINSVDAYIDFFSETAQLEMKAYGIPASITLAQGLLESGLGKGELALKSNNHFGIKCHTGWTGDYVTHDDDEKGECFRKYNHPMYSYRDHSIFLSTRSRYASLFNLDLSDYKGWARGLRKAGYATDKKYPEKLISLIERYELYRYDDAGLAKRPMVKEIKEPEAKDVVWVKTTESDLETDTGEIQTATSVSTVNYTVRKGDSLWAISKKYGVSVDQLRKWNNMRNNNLAIGQKLIVKK